MNRTIRYILLSFMLLTVLSSAQAIVKGMEDLWGNPVKFDKKKLSVVSSVNSATCGYCLVDGQFVKKNYGYYTTKLGGDYYLNSIYNTQRDLYAFAKHYGEQDVPFLTFPPALRDEYQDGGYPYLYALKKGKLIFHSFIGPYGAVLDSLKELFWHDKTLLTNIASPLHMGNRAIYESGRNSAVFVVQDSTLKARFADNYHSYIVKTIDELTLEDLQKDLMFQQCSGAKYQKLFQRFNIPITLNSKLQWEIGDYSFDADSVYISATFPNPYNTSKYLVIRQFGKLFKARLSHPDNWLDFTITGVNKETKQAELLLYGIFQQDGNQWSYSDSLTYGINRKQECVGQCPLPVVRKVETHPEPKLQYGADFTANQPYISISGDEVRFPSIATRDSNIYLAYEHEGDIYLSTYYEDEFVSTEALENEFNDSYDAIPVVCGDELWVFYLKQVEGFYRLYGQVYGMGLWSDEILISDYQPCDVVTPAATAFGNEITLTWTVWQANNRYLYERRIIDGVLQPITLQKIVFKKDFDYSNAWYADVQYDSAGKLWKTWNQHYPYTQCIAAACDTLSPALVTGDYAEMDNFLLGYPSLTLDSQNRPWVFFTDGTETMFWKQSVQGSYLRNGNWVTPFKLADEPETLYQTPMALTDSQGTIWVIWSERHKKGNWHLTYSRFSGDRWTELQAFTSEQQSSRAPQLALYQDKIAVCYHVFDKGKMSIRTVLLP